MKERELLIVKLGDNFMQEVLTEVGKNLSLWEEESHREVKR